jgi:signal transduction histidine kinase
MTRRRWSLALAVVFAGLLVWYITYTQRIVEALQADGAVLTEVFAAVQEWASDPDPASSDQTLFELQRLVLEMGVPLVYMDAADSVLAAVNLPFEANPATPEGQATIRAYADQLSARQSAVEDPAGNHIYFGDTPVVRQLRWVPWLQVGGFVFVALVGFLVIRFQRRAETERAWAGMARELAHQLGTPLSSMEGWLELMKLPPDERPEGLAAGEIARGVEEDLERLERVSRRFELIGRSPDLHPLSLSTVGRELETYIRARLPRFGSDVRLIVDIPESLPLIRGNGVLLVWALENLVKNSLDALAGQGGRIMIYARAETPGWVTLRVRDTGPGVAADVRERLFDPGVTSKETGWGVGLALARRIFESMHGGRIELLERNRRGATFQVRLPALAESSGPEPLADPQHAGPSSHPLAPPRASG